MGDAVPGELSDEALATIMDMALFAYPDWTMDMHPHTVRDCILLVSNLFAPFAWDQLLVVSWCLARAVFSAMVMGLVMAVQDPKGRSGKTETFETLGKILPPVMAKAEIPIATKAFFASVETMPAAELETLIEAEILYTDEVDLSAVPLQLLKQTSSGGSFPFGSKGLDMPANKLQIWATNDVLTTQLPSNASVYERLVMVLPTRTATYMAKNFCKVQASDNALTQLMTWLAYVHCTYPEMPPSLSSLMIQALRPSRSKVEAVVEGVSSWAYDLDPTATEYESILATALFKAEYERQADSRDFASIVHSSLPSYMFKSTELSKIMGVGEYISGFKVKSMGVAPSKVWELYSHGMTVAMGMDQIWKSAPSLYEYLATSQSTVTPEDRDEIIDKDLKWHEQYRALVSTSSQAYLKSANDWSALMAWNKGMDVDEARSKGDSKFSDKERSKGKGKGKHKGKA